MTVTAFADRITVAWQAPSDASGLTGYLIRRAGTELGAVSAGITTYSDASANLGSLSAPTLTAGFDARADAVDLSWTAAEITPAELPTYDVRAVYGDRQSSPISGQATRPSLVYEVQRDGGAWLEVGGDLAYSDTDAPGRELTITGNPTAQADIRGIVVLGLPAVVVGEVRTVVYAVRARLGEVVSAPSATQPGRRQSAEPQVRITWQRSATADGDDFTDLPGVTGHVWFDAQPVYGESRRYRARVVEAGTVELSTATSARVYASTSIAAGSSHSCALRSDGSIACWGANDDGQAPTTALAPDHKALAVGLNHNCALRADDTATCWGDNASDQSTPASGAFTAIAVGASRSCGLRSDGSAQCWGLDASTQAGPFSAIAVGSFSCGLRQDGAITCWGSDAESPPAGQFTAITVGIGGHGCAIGSQDGALTRWGDDGLGQASPPSGAFIDVSAGVYSTCGVRDNGLAECWGNGVPGSGVTPGIPLSGQTPPLESLAKVSTGGGHVCGLRANGSHVCWGSNDAGQAPPVPIQDEFVAIDAGRNHTCAVRADNRPVCWGRNNLGQAPRSTPDGVFSAVTTALSASYSCGIRDGGAVACWGDRTAPDITVTLLSARSTDLCSVSAGQPPTCGNAETVPDGNFLTLDSGAEHTCGIREVTATVTSALACWGGDSAGQISGQPADVAFKAVAAGGSFTCAITRDDDTASCWGAAVAQLPASLADVTFASLTCGGFHCCGIRTDGPAVCWGRDVDGQAPPTATLDAFDTIAGGRDHTCGIRTDGKVQCWGLDDFGQAPPLGAIER